MKFGGALVVFSALAGSAAAFTNPNVIRTPFAIESATSLNSALSEEPKDISYGEESRSFRRTVYTHDDWVRHRSPTRFARNLRSATSSGVYKNLAKEVITTTAIASFIVVSNMLTGGFVDFNNVAHDPIIQSPIPQIGLPLNAFTVSAPFLSLLLVFRTNSSYKRWDEARKNWGMNINHTRDLVRMATAFYDPKYPPGKKAVDIDLQQPTIPRIQDMTVEQLVERKAKLNDVALATWAFVRAMKRHLSPEWEDEADFKVELYEKLPREQAEAIINAAHRPNRALTDLSNAIEELPMHFFRKHEIHAAVTIFEDNLGSSERLLTSPVPLFYSRHLARFISVWMLLLPFAMYEPFKGTWNHVGMIPAISLLSVFLFGIEEIGIQLEEPFTVLPMQAFCDKIYNWCFEIVSWTPGDNEPTPPGPEAERKRSVAEQLKNMK